MTWDQMESDGMPDTLKFFRLLIHKASGNPVLLGDIRERNCSKRFLGIAHDSYRRVFGVSCFFIGKHLPTTPIPPKISEIDPTYLPTTPRGVVGR